MTLEERCALFRPMPCRDALRLPWVNDAMYPPNTDGPVARTRRWCDAGFPDPPDHGLLGFIGPERRLFETFTRATARILAPFVRWFIACNVVGVAVGDKANGWLSAWPTCLTTGKDEGLVLAAVSGALSNDEEIESVIAHEIAHGWLGPIKGESGLTLDGLQDPPDPDTLRAEWGAGAQNLIRLDEWRTASLARSWGFTGRAADPTRYERRMIVTGEG